jgi:hypothetical protein
MVIASSQTHFNPAATAAAGGRLDDFQTSASLCPVKVDLQKKAKMLAQSRCGFQNGGIAV